MCFVFAQAYAYLLSLIIFLSNIKFMKLLRFNKYVYCILNGYKLIALQNFELFI